MDVVRVTQVFIKSMLSTAEVYANAIYAKYAKYATDAIYAKYAKYATDAKAAN